MSDSWDHGHGGCPGVFHGHRCTHSETGTAPASSQPPPACSCLFTGTLKSYFLARFPDTIPAMNCHCHAVLEVPGGLLTPHPHPGRVCSAHTPLAPHPPLRRRAARRLGFLRLAESSDVLSGFLSGSAVSRASRPPGLAVLSPVAASASSLRLSRTPLQVSRRFRPADNAGRLVSWLL